LSPSTTPDLATEDLLRRMKDGDAAAAEALYARYLAPLQRWARGRLPSAARGGVDTGDIVQETLVRVLQRVETFEDRGPGAFFAYLRQALLNRVRDEARKVARRPQEGGLLEAPSPDPSPVEIAIGAERLARFERALATLPPDDREAVLARLELGFSYAQIAEALGKPSADAARMAVSRAILKLAQELAE
jgi:RNA polymerase sigma-70 factor (ECF subfamily)